MNDRKNKEKTGVKLEGVEAINPATGEKVPLYVADYVLAHYGTGAIMAVRLTTNATGNLRRKFNIAVKQVVSHVVHNTEGAYAVRPREPFKYRDASHVHRKALGENEYLCQEWTDYSGIRTLISGGIEDGEDVVATGKREIKEESDIPMRNLFGTLRVFIHRVLPPAERDEHAGTFPLFIL